MAKRKRGGVLTVGQLTLRKQKKRWRSETDQGARKLNGWIMRRN